jgi:hypothetical protein
MVSGYTATSHLGGVSTIGQRIHSVHFSIYSISRETRVTIAASLHDLDHDGWSTYDENVLKLSRVAFWGVIRILQSNINIYYSPQSAAPPL